jgi:alpha-glucosidase
MAPGPWWHNASIYQIYPLSFLDSDGDGYGDLPGITSRLEYLASGSDGLGVDAIWLSPIYRSPMVDFGYDVSDHCDVDPRFGTVADADALIAHAHQLGLRVLLDYVPNHTSDRHRWFEQSRRSRTDPYRDWYVWADPRPDGGPPNNWLSAFERVGSAWTFDDRTGQYYLHSYTAEQPDLNWRHPAVRAAMHDVLRFWLDRAVDGFRIDAPHRLGKDPLLRDNPSDVVSLRVATQIDERRHLNLGDPYVHDLLRGIRSVVDAYPGRLLVGEVGIHHPRRRLEYYGNSDELNLIFDFGFWSNPWQADAFRRSGAALTEIEADRWPTHALSNHDISRHASRYGRQGARVAAVLLATLPGTTFLYYGEEIGMMDVPVPSPLATDPNGRDPYRTPMQWNLSKPAAGFSTGEPWRPVPERGVDLATQRDDSNSLFSLYRELLDRRRSHPSLTSGSYRELQSGDDVYAFARETRDVTLIVVLNFVSEPRIVRVPVADAGRRARVIIGSHPTTAEKWLDLSHVELAADEAIVAEIVRVDR